MPTEIIRQSSFKSGEVDPIHYSRADYSDYLTAAQSLLNMEITATGTARKRKGTAYIGGVDSNPLGEKAILASIKDTQGNYYIVVISDRFYIYTTDMVLKFSINSPYSDPSLIDFTNDNDSLIIVSPNEPPNRIFYKGDSFVLERLNIAPPPAYDFGDLDYSDYTFTIVNAPFLKPSERLVNTSLIFGKEYIGGQFIGKGSSIEAPVGVGIIKTASDGSRFLIDVTSPFVENTPLKGTEVTLKAPAFSKSKGYPSKVIYFQNRLWFASTKSLPNTIFGSKINRLANFDTGTGKDSEAIIYSIGQQDTGEIRWLNGGKQLEIYTENNEFSCAQGDGIALTPSTFTIKQQSSFGTSKIAKPVSYLNDSYFISRSGNSILNFKYQGLGQSYLATNVSLTSAHLVKNPKRAAVLRGEAGTQDNYIYYLNNDSSITALQLSEAQQSCALTPFEFDYQMKIIDIISINNNVYLLALLKNNDTVVLKFYRDKLLMDSVASGALNQDGKLSAKEFSGLSNLQVTFNNQDYGIYDCDAKGDILIPENKRHPGAYLVGFNYSAVVKTMYFTAGGNSTDYKKFVTRAFVDYFQSFNFKINGKLVPYQFYKTLKNNQIFAEGVTGIAKIDYIGGWHKLRNLTITQESPYDLHIRSIAYQITYGVI